MAHSALMPSAQHNYYLIFIIISFCSGLGVLHCWTNPPFKMIDKPEPQYVTAPTIDYGQYDAPTESAGDRWKRKAIEEPFVPAGKSLNYIFDPSYRNRLVVEKGHLRVMMKEVQKKERKKTFFLHNQSCVKSLSGDNWSV